MPTEKFVQANPDEVAAKVVQGEAIIINLATGVYYSMTGVGAAAWGLLEATGDVARTVETLCVSYNVDAARCRGEVERLVAELLTERLLLPGDGPAGNGPVPAATSLRQSWEAPTLNIYRDMSDLMALDPPVPGLAPIPWNDPQLPRRT
jgi:fermentation-respiration switch protein FrsA (DUF1100 family)